MMLVVVIDFDNLFVWLHEKQTILQGHHK